MFPKSKKLKTLYEFPSGFTLGDVLQHGQIMEQQGYQRGLADNKRAWDEGHLAGYSEAVRDAIGYHTKETDK